MVKGSCAALQLHGSVASNDLQRPPRASMPDMADSSAPRSYARRRSTSLRRRPITVGSAVREGGSERRVVCSDRSLMLCDRSQHIHPLYARVCSVTGHSRDDRRFSETSGKPRRPHEANGLLTSADTSVRCRLPSPSTADQSRRWLCSRCNWRDSRQACRRRARTRPRDTCARRAPRRAGGRPSWR
jgi:hypothetical protein